MRRPGVLLAMAVAGPLVAAGCATGGPAAGPPAAPAAPPALASLNTSIAASTGTWAVAVMGGSAAQYNNFWQLFTRPARSNRWILVTPPGTADNGGLVLATAGQMLVTAFRPSQFLSFTPLIRTSDSGRAWASLRPLGGPIAGSPDALALRPDGTLLAVLRSGVARLAAPAYTTWKTLASLGTLARTAAGRRCGPTVLTAATFSPSGTPLLGSACARAGIAGIFAHVRGAWRAAGPALPRTLTSERVTVLRLTRAGRQVVALLAGSGHGGSLVAGLSADGGAHWAVSPVLMLHGARVISSSFGPGGTAAIELTGRRGEIVSPGLSWLALPSLPTGTVTLAVLPGGSTDALAVRRATLTIWLSQSGAGWVRAQTIKVPIQYGSSG